MPTEINKRKPTDRSSPPLWFSWGLAVTFPQDNLVTKVTPAPRLTPISPRQTISLRRTNCDGCRIRTGKFVHKLSPPTSKEVPGKSDRLNSGLMRWQLSVWPFLKCIEGSKDGKSSLLDAEVCGAISQASLSYLRQVRAWEQSKEQWCWDPNAVIPQPEKVTETIYGNLDSLPVINIANNNSASLEKRATFGQGWCAATVRTFYCN